MRVRVQAFARAAVAVVLLAGCTADRGGDRSDGDGLPPAGANEAVAARSYGYGPVDDESVTYQPDVVLIGGGPGVIRFASADGIVWTLDGDARGVSDLAVGKVMYATSRAVGRVAEIRRVGGDVAVTLAPVGLTEVFRDAHFVSDRDVSAADLFVQEVPKLPGAMSVPAEPRRSLTGEAVPIAHRLAADDRLPPPKATGSVGVAVGNWEVQPSHRDGVIGLKVGYKAVDRTVAGDTKTGTSVKAGLKVFADVSFKYRQLRMRSDVRITGGQVDSRSTFALEGIQSVAVNIAAGAANGAADNSKIRIEVPVETVVPIPGWPLLTVFSWKFIVSTAITGNNSTLKAGGEWRLDGPIGVVNGALSAPELTVSKSIMDSITGLSVGVSGVVFAVEMKAQAGIGMPVAFAGPYAKVVLSLGLTNGSALGAPLARCVGATLDGKVGAGVGVSLSFDALTALQKLLPQKVKYKADTERIRVFYHRSLTLPAVSLCGG
ncbi:hypothetical protein ACTMSW_26570 [Micromonospora sp. BQ11]|uniref:hypothetical protein n=1 Tax=Micromonospora sp. BQ11 TaxID=3452212 RepID=UPI003F8B4F27